MKPNPERLERWRFTSAIGTCALFIKGLNGLRDNKLLTGEIAAQADLACAEVKKLSSLLKDRFKKGAE